MKKWESRKPKKILLYTQAFMCFQEKNSWKAKYEKQKVKTSIYKEEQCKDMDSLLYAAQQEVSGSRMGSASELRRSKRKNQA